MKRRTRWTVSFATRLAFFGGIVRATVHTSKVSLSPQKRRCEQKTGNSPPFFGSLGCDFFCVDDFALWAFAGGFDLNDWGIVGALGGVRGVKKRCLMRGGEEVEGGRRGRRDSTWATGTALSGPLSNSKRVRTSSRGA